MPFFQQERAGAEFLGLVDWMRAPAVQEMAVLRNQLEELCSFETFYRPNQFISFEVCDPLHCACSALTDLVSLPATASSLVGTECLRDRGAAFTSPTVLALPCCVTAMSCLFLSEMAPLTVPSKMVAGLFHREGGARQDPEGATAGAHHSYDAPVHRSCHVARTSRAVLPAPGVCARRALLSRDPGANT
jgi:hypothetical protein